MDKTLTRRAEIELEQSVVKILRREPFYGHLLSSVVRRIDGTIATAAVTISPLGVSLAINPCFFLEKLSDEERCAVIKHEILHLVLKHLFRHEGPGINRMLLNLASDLVVNQLVYPWPLPKGAITLDCFPELKLQPNKSVEHYYKALEKANSDPETTALLGKLESGSPSDHGRWAACGGEGFAERQDQSTAAESRTSGKMSAPQLTEQLARILEESFNRQLQQARSRLSTRQWGDLPGSIRALLEKKSSIDGGTIDWKRALRLFASAGYRTRIAATTRRRSRRFGTYPGVRIRRERRLAVVVDTSGSISPQELNLFFAEIALIHRTGAEILVIESDAAVAATYLYRGVVPATIHGGGGTDFTPAFRWLRDGSGQRFDGCIYLTDGYADPPTVKPPCRLLWVVTPSGRCGEHLRWGKQIRMQAS